MQLKFFLGGSRSLPGVGFQGFHAGARVAWTIFGNFGMRNNTQEAIAASEGLESNPGAIQEPKNVMILVTVARRGEMFFFEAGFSVRF